MKLSFVTVFATTALLFVKALPTSESDVGLEARQGNRCGSRSRAVPFYRLYNSKTVDHFYTTNRAELQATGYTREGISSLIFNIPQPGTIPFYRLYSPSDTDHFYTTSASERTSALKDGYQSEGVAGYIYPNSKCGGVPFYRLYDAKGKDHFYTTSPSERASAEKSGYTSEGIAGYVYKS